MQKKRSNGNTCKGCGCRDQKLGEIFQGSQIPKDVSSDHEVWDFEKLMHAYGHSPRYHRSNTPQTFLRLSRTSNAIDTFHQGAIACLFCPRCGRVTLLRDPAKVHVFS